MATAKKTPAKRTAKPKTVAVVSTSDGPAIFGGYRVEPDVPTELPADVAEARIASGWVKKA